MDASNDPARLPTPARRASIDGGDDAPAGRAGVLARAFRKARESTWAAVVARGLGIGAGMVALAAIGAAGTLSGTGVPIATAAPASASVSPLPSVAPSSSGASAPPQAVASAGASAEKPPGAGITADGKVVLNEANADELMKLPRVGPKRAQAILEVRKRLGRFRQPTDLLRVKGIGRKTLRVMLPLLVVDPPAK